MKYRWTTRVWFWLSYVIFVVTMLTWKCYGVAI